MLNLKALSRKTKIAVAGGIGAVLLLAQVTDVDWPTQVKNRPHITITGSNAVWTDNVTMSGTNTLSGPLVITGTDSGNQSISGNKTFTGTSTLSGPLVITGTDSGNQTISGNKTFTGTNTFSGATTSFSPPITIASGGTNATTASGARTSLAVPGLADNNTLTGTNTFSGQASFTNTANGVRNVVISGNATANNNQLQIANTAASGHTWDVGEMFTVGHLSHRDLTQTGQPAWSFVLTGTAAVEAILSSANTSSRTYTFPDATGGVPLLTTANVWTGSNSFASAATCGTGTVVCMSGASAASGGLDVYVGQFAVNADEKFLVNPTNGNVVSKGLHIQSTSAGTFTGTDTLAISTAGLVTTYNTTATAGQGVSWIPCATSQKTETAADTNLLTCVIPAVAASYRVRFILNVSAASAATLGWTTTWVDSNGTAPGVANLALFGVGVAAPQLTWTISSGGDFYGMVDLDVNNSATNIVVKLTFTGTSFTGKASATVERIL